MTSAVKLSVVAFALAIVAALPARAEASSYTLSSCLEDKSGLCDSLPIVIEAPEDSGLVDSTFVADRDLESSKVVESFQKTLEIFPMTFGEIVEALQSSSADAGFRIVSHVRGSESGGLATDNLLCCSAAIASPEPASISLFGLALIAAAYRLRRRWLPSVDDAVEQMAPASQPPDPRG